MAHLVAILLLNLIHVTESISGSVVPLAMFYRTALALAARHGSVAAAQVLIKAGADVDSQAWGEGITNLTPCFLL